MTKDEQIAILESVAALVDGNVRNSYSGRYMFGKTCYGIDCKDSIQCIEETSALGLRGARVDSMGRGYIIYWPSISDDK